MTETARRSDLTSQHGLKTEGPAEETQSGQWCAVKDVTVSKDPAEIRVAYIWQVCDACQAEKRPESEGAIPLNFKFVAVCGSGKIVKIGWSDPRYTFPEFRKRGS